MPSAINTRPYSVKIGRHMEFLNSLKNGRKKLGIWTQSPPPLKKYHKICSRKVTNIVIIRGILMINEIHKSHKIFAKLFKRECIRKSSKRLIGHNMIFF